MRIAVFFAYLCLLLLGGNGRAYAAIHENNDHSSVSHADNTKRQIVQVLQHGLIKDIEVDKEKEFLICDDSEDDDVSNSFTKKHKLQARYSTMYPCHFSQSGLNYFPNNLKTVSSFYKTVSPRYILQRSLRI